MREVIEELEERRRIARLGGGEKELKLSMREAS